VKRGQRGGSRTVVNLSFLDRSHYFFFQVAPHLSPRELVDPVPDPLLRGKSGSAGIEPGTSVSAVTNSNH
jgi:hypothetical protein